MRDVPYELKAPTLTVSITLNSDLCARAKRLDINVSQVAEQVVADAYTRKRAEALTAEIQADLAAAADFVRVRFHVDDGSV